MSSVNQLDPLNIPAGFNTLDHFCVSRDGKYVAITTAQNRAVIEVFSTKDACHVSTVHVPGYGKAAYVPSSLRVAFTWASNDDGQNSNILLVVSSMGHFFQSKIGGETVHVKNFNPRNTTSKNFHKIAWHRDITVIASDRELIAISSPDNRAAVFPYCTDPNIVDQVISMDIHPSGCFVSLCTRERRSLLIVALNNSKPELTSQLGRTPKDIEDENNFQTPAEEEEGARSFPCIINEIFFTTANRTPIACSWSKYADNLVVASSDSLLSIWNVPSSTIATVSLDDDVIIRNVTFVNDSLVAVAINNTNRVFFVDVDEGVLYETPENATKMNTKNPSLDFAYNKGGTNLIVFRPSLAGPGLNRWLLSL
jgi:hypothetical protein